MKRIFRSLAALLIIVISFSAISFAWLASGKYLNFPSSFGGSATPAYFAGGNGSEKYPFIGEFNGNGHKVTNLTISNKKGTGDLVFSPTNANFSSGNMLCRVNDSTKTQEIEIVGMFGVTGNQTPTGTGSTMDKVRFVNSGTPTLDSNGVVDVSAYKPALITLSRGNFTDAAIAIFKRDTVPTGDKYKLAYRVEYLDPKETTTGMTRKDTTLTPSTDD